MSDLNFPTAHRPWPLRRGPYVMVQSWHDLLFAHYRIDAAQLRPLLPASLELETFDGSAWVAVVPFRMSGVRPRWVPPMPGLSAFPELNVRTYVTHGGKPGVWFLSLEAANAMAVSIARRFFHLPYFRARMTCEGEEQITYRSERTHRGAPPLTFEGTYGPTGPVALATPGSFAHWATERYCLYAQNPAGVVYRGEIHHEPWPIQPAKAEFTVDTALVSHGLSPDPSPPHLLFARRLDVRVWALCHATQP